MRHFKEYHKQSVDKGDLIIYKISDDQQGIAKIKKLIGDEENPQLLSIDLESGTQVIVATRNILEIWKKGIE